MDLPDPKRKRTVFLAAAGVILVAVLVAVFAIRGAGRVTTDDAYIEGRVHSVAPKIAGTVMKAVVVDNQAVKSGDLLVLIDPADIELRVKEAEAALSAEKARLLDAEAGIRAAEANVRMQEVALNQAGLDKARAEALFQENVISREKHEKVMTQFALAEATAKASGEQLEKAKSQRELEGALIEQKQAALDIAQRDLDYTKIAAPADGYVTRKSVEAGNQVQAGQPLMAIISLEDIWIVANFKETQLKKVRPGQEVLVKVDTYPGKVFRGRVDSLMAGTGAAFSLFPPENALGNYVKVVQRVPVKIVLDKATDARHVLRIGMSCVPTILTGDE